MQAIPLYTLADPVPGDGSLGEIRLVQPVLMVHAVAFDGRLGFTGTIDVEGLTIPDGELTPGAWGEGFVDRRHPHTYAHELMLSVQVPVRRADRTVWLSLSAGKGFAPFGTDDPMARPTVRYPVNHHLAQILERALVTVAARSRYLTAELGLFNGDEPERPGQWPRVSGRFGDSWSARVTGRPVVGLEFQGSYASVHSPEHRPGAGTDQDKWSASVRWSRKRMTDGQYALAEWARTSEAGGAFVFHSLLVEGAWSRGGGRLYYRFERTARPEEERIGRFRSLRPHLENSMLGITRWTLNTVGASWRMTGGRSPVRLEPFVEGTIGRVSDVGTGVFNAGVLYGKRSVRGLAIGIRAGAGTSMHRMGRYGVAGSPESESHHDVQNHAAH